MTADIHLISVDALHQVGLGVITRYASFYVVLVQQDIH